MKNNNEILDEILAMFKKSEVHIQSAQKHFQMQMQQASKEIDELVDIVNSKEGENDGYKRNV